MKDNSRKSNAGRPSKYDPERLEEIEKMAGIGLTDKDIALLLGVKERVFYYWKKKYPEFVQALKRGKTTAKMTIVNSLYRRAIEGNLTAIIFWLVNRYPEEWRNIQKMEHTISAIPPIKYIPANKTGKQNGEKVNKDGK